MSMGMSTRLYRYPMWWGWDKTLISVGFGYGDVNEFFFMKMSIG